MMMKYEKRMVDVEELRVEGGGDAGPTKIVGYSAVFNRLSNPITDWRGTYREKIHPGAFKKALASSDVRALINHDHNLVLGRNKAKTLVLEEDDIGLHVEIMPPNTTYANDLVESIGRGDIDQMSFAFRPDKEDFREENGELIREHFEFRSISDVSIVTYPAYEETMAAIRSLDLAQMGPTLGDQLDLHALLQIINRYQRSLPLGASELQVVQKAVSYFQQIAELSQAAGSASNTSGTQAGDRLKKYWDQLNAIDQ